MNSTTIATWLTTACSEVGIAVESSEEELVVGCGSGSGGRIGDSLPELQMKTDNDGYAKVAEMNSPPTTVVW